MGIGSWMLSLIGFGPAAKPEPRDVDQGDIDFAQFDTKLSGAIVAADRIHDAAQHAESNLPVLGRFSIPEHAFTLDVLIDQMQSNCNELLNKYSSVAATAGNPPFDSMTGDNRKVNAAVAAYPHTVELIRQRIAILQANKELVDANKGNTGVCKKMADATHEIKELANGLWDVFTRFRTIAQPIMRLTDGSKREDLTFIFDQGQNNIVNLPIQISDGIMTGASSLPGAIQQLDNLLEIIAHIKRVLEREIPSSPPTVAQHLITLAGQADDLTRQCRVLRAAMSNVPRKISILEYPKTRDDLVGFHKAVTASAQAFKRETGALQVLISKSAHKSY